MCPLPVRGSLWTFPVLGQALRDPSLPRSPDNMIRCHPDHQVVLVNPVTRGPILLTKNTIHCFGILQCWHLCLPVACPHRHGMMLLIPLSAQKHQTKASISLTELVFSHFFFFIEKKSFIYLKNRGRYRKRAILCPLAPCPNAVKQPGTLS